MSQEHYGFQTPTPEEIALCAYHIWEQEGRPIGRAREHWLQAETQLEAYRALRVLRCQKTNMTIREYTPEEELREVSLQYIHDAHQFAKQAGVLLRADDLVRDCEFHLGYLSKIAVILYMSIECSLKALICTSHIGEDPHSVYWKRIRPAGHFFKKLKAEIPNFAAVINDPKLETAIDKLCEAEVSERYCLEISSESNLLNTFNIDPAKLAEEIKEVSEILKTATQLREIVWEFRKTEFDGHRTLPPHLVKDVLKKIKTK